jgi:hypothetical protein
MARLPRVGHAFSALYELDVTLEAMIARLGLNALSESENESFRETLGRAIGLFLQEAYAQSSIDVARTLNQIAQGCELASETLSALTPGLRSSLDIEVAHLMAKAVAQNPSYRSIEEAKIFLEGFAVQASTVAHAARVTTALLKNTKHKGGRDALHWHDVFTKAIMQICELNDIKPKINTNRVTDDPEGRFLHVAAGLEKVLYPKMRSPSRVALVQRLKRSLKRLKATTGTKP